MDVVTYQEDRLADAMSTISDVLNNIRRLQTVECSPEKARGGHIGHTARDEPLTNPVEISFCLLRTFLSELEASAENWLLQVGHTFGSLGLIPSGHVPVLAQRRVAMLHRQKTA